MTKLFALLLLLVPALALADDVNAKKFNQKQIEKDFAPLLAFTKGGIVDNEVMLARDEVHDSHRATYVVKTALKPVLDFYTQKLGTEGKKTGEETLGDVKYTFTRPVTEEDKRAYIVIVTPLGKSRTQIALIDKPATGGDD